MPGALIYCTTVIGQIVSSCIISERSLHQMSENFVYTVYTCRIILSVSIYMYVCTTLYMCKNISLFQPARPTNSTHENH